MAGYRWMPQQTLFALAGSHQCRTDELLALRACRQSPVGNDIARPGEATQAKTGPAQGSAKMCTERCLDRHRGALRGARSETIATRSSANQETPSAVPYWMRPAASRGS